MTHESVSVKCSAITWFLWLAAGLLLIGATIHVCVNLGPWSTIVLVGWALYIVTGAAVWTIQQSIGAATRKVDSHLERLERLERQQGGRTAEAGYAVRSLR